MYTLDGPLGKNLTFGAPIEIYRRRRRAEFIGGGGVPAAAPTSDNYVKSVTRKYPSIHVLLPGVLPVHCAYEDQALNVKIKLYNHYLQDMCNHLNRVHFIDVNVFCDLNGSLKPHLSKGDRDPLHLNEQGIKLFASRFKYALRVHHNLPQAPRRSFHQAPVSNSAGNYQVAPP